ncbi:MAG: hypothetical protein GY847_25115 [Proteobacteria bacterium]|nr:hypothetical protein [Pseudomonadota bacterium]
MKLTWAEVVECGLSAVFASERNGSIVYLLKREFTPGESLVVDRKSEQRDVPMAMLFVDLKPEQNWAHSCRYILVNLETGAVEIMPAGFPPYFPKTPPDLCLVHKGDQAPVWALLTSNGFDG